MVPNSSKKSRSVLILAKNHCHVYVTILSRTNRSGKPWVTFNISHSEENKRDAKKDATLPSNHYKMKHQKFLANQTEAKINHTDHYKICFKSKMGTKKSRIPSQNSSTTKCVLVSNISIMRVNINTFLQIRGCTRSQGYNKILGFCRIVVSTSPSIL